MSIEQIVKSGLQRNEVFDIIPERASRILDVGYGDGCLLMRLKHQKACTEVFGIEIQPRKLLDEHLDGNWSIDLTDPSQNLGEPYENFFNYIILHDVLEHIYNPWGFLQTIRTYLADSGKCIVVSPNAQYWELPYALLSGEFPYGVHGYWNEDHIRWFTLKSLTEVALLAGFRVDESLLLYPESMSRFQKPFNTLMARGEEGTLDLPPFGWSGGHLVDAFPFASPTANLDRPISIRFPAHGGSLPYFFAIKLMLVCAKAEPTPPVVMSYQALPAYRKAFQESHSREELAALVPRSVRAIMERR